MSDEVEPADEESPRNAYMERERTLLIEKGYTPHNKLTTGPLEQNQEGWWDRNTPQFTWPQAAVLIALLAFVAIILKVPTT